MSPESRPTLEVERLVHRYGRSARRSGDGRTALRGLSFQAEGAVLGLIGPNGAGKTTLLRYLAGFLRPSGGRIRVGGLEPAAYRRLHGLGYLPERTGLPSYARVETFLGTVAALCERVPEAAVRAVLEAAGLSALARARIGALSHGTRRRVALAAVELGRPRLLILDEPTNGLDPVAVRELRALVTRWRSEGRRVVISSHHLDEVQRVADEVLLLWEGRLRDRRTAGQIAQMGPGGLDAWFTDASGPACGGFAPP